MKKKMKSILAIFCLAAVAIPGLSNAAVWTNTQIFEVYWMPGFGGFYEAYLSTHASGSDYTTYDHIAAVGCFVVLGYEPTVFSMYYCDSTRHDVVWRSDEGSFVSDYWQEMAVPMQSFFCAGNKGAMQQVSNDVWVDVDSYPTTDCLWVD